MVNELPKSPGETSPLFTRPSHLGSNTSPTNTIRRRSIPVRMLLLIAVVLLFVFNVGRRRRVYLHGPSPAVDTTVVSATTKSGANRTVSARVLTLNTFMRPVLVGINDYKDARIADLSQAVGVFDIVCFQELFWTSGPRKARFLRDIADKHGINYAASVPVPGLPGLFRFQPKIIDGGLVIASRFPIVEADYYTYSQSNLRSIDKIVAKGVLYARISIIKESPQRYVHVFTTHMQADNDLKGIPFEETRVKQLRELTAFVRRKTANDPYGVILFTGDLNINARAGFNDASSSKEYDNAMRILQTIRPHIKLQDLLYDANGQSHPITSAGGLDGSTQKKEQLDYIFLSSPDNSRNDLPLVAHAMSGSVRVEEFRKRATEKDKTAHYNTLSDHYGVQADIMFLDAGGTR